MWNWRKAPVVHPQTFRISFLLVSDECVQYCVCIFVACVAVCADEFSDTYCTQCLHATLLPLSIHICLLPSLIQTLSSLFFSKTKQQFTVLPIKAYIHAANYQWHDSFGLDPLHLISPLPFPSSQFGSKITIQCWNSVSLHSDMGPLDLIRFMWSIV